MSDWVEYVVAEGRAARKWFGDHYKEVHVSPEPDGDLEAACEAVDRDDAARIVEPVEVPPNPNVAEVAEFAEPQAPVVVATPEEIAAAPAPADEAVPAEADNTAA